MNEWKVVWRRLFQARGFTVVVLLTLALCLGANVTIFAAIDAILLRALPFPAADQLVTMYNSYPNAGIQRSPSSFYNFYQRRDHIEAFSSLSIWNNGDVALSLGDESSQAPVMRISPEFFATLGVSPATGRSFTENESKPGADNVIIVSDEFARERFSGVATVLGQSVRVDGANKTIVGILPPGFRFLSATAQLYLPLAPNPEVRSVNSMHSGAVEMLARLKPGATLAMARQQIAASNAAQEPLDPWREGVAASGFQTVLVPLHGDHVESIRPVLWLLQIGVLFLLLIGGVNLINLLMIRASAKAKENSIRQALGAQRRHVLRDVLSETLSLAIAGGLLGLLIGLLGIRALSWLGADALPLGSQIVFDARLVLVTLLAALVVGVLLAWPIVWTYWRGNFAAALQSEARGGSGSKSTQALRQSFIVAQIALAFVLLTGAALLGMSFKRALQTSPGFGHDGILTARLHIPENAPREQLAARLYDRLRAIPGVLSAALSNNVPMRGKGVQNDNNVMTVEGYVVPAGVSPRAHFRYGVAGDYFGAMGIALIQGRSFTNAESLSTQRVCVVDQSFAKHYWPGGNALGQRVFEGPDRRPLEEAFTVVGVVADVKQNEITESDPPGTLYLPLVYVDMRNSFIVARSVTTPEALAPALAQMLKQVDPQIALHDVRSMQTRIDDSLVARRSPAILAGVFAGTALLLAAIGTYGVLSYAVSGRRLEIGVRMALGANPGSIRWHFLLFGFRLLAVGSVFGSIGALVAGRAMQSVLFGVPGLPVATLIGCALVLALIALLASVLPAHRASKIAPVEAMIAK
jgi:predicted permease